MDKNNLFNRITHWLAVTYFFMALAISVTAFWQMNNFGT